MKKIFTLCVVFQSSRVLLGMKKRGFGEGRWNGFGGKIKDGETIEEAMRREMHEEAGVKIDSAEHVGILDFEFSEQDGSASLGEILTVHIFRVDSFTGEPRESDEMKPQWFDIADVPYEIMWPDDKYWMPLLFDGKKFHGKFVFGKGDVVREYSIDEVQKI
ncbi:MAG: 8-oxo-dGTP diphosphatase [Patescibacteria group bacterium]|nr:8-oxo-dGTP diphosphatase [Patescibacteria group bacterium]